MLRSVVIIILSTVFIEVQPLLHNAISENSDTDELIVQLLKPSSKIRGHILQSNNGTDFYAFQDIPFAAPPIGENRLRPPKPVVGWDGILNTTQNTKGCLQDSPDPATTLNFTEDCLYLNVYTPVKPSSNASLPVYVWIYGGAFVEGDASISTYNPKYLIEWDIVLVTLNYRLGALGFLTTNDENLPGNLGLKDQSFAIKWVADNIQAFGGNPKRITVGGQSIGASSVSYQYLSRKNEGLLSGVIIQSGSALGITTYQPNYREFAFELGRILDKSFNSNSSKDLREVLLNATEDDILKAQNEVHSNLTNGFMNDIIYAPIIEDKLDPDAFITGHMLYDFHQGNFNEIPSLTGFNSEEALVFIELVNETEYEALAKSYDEDPSLLISAKIDVIPGERSKAGKQLKELYTNSSFQEDKGAFVRFTSDASFVRPLIRQVGEAAYSVPQYMYQFAYSETPTAIPGTENTKHGQEIQYFWGYTRGFEENNETIRLRLLKLWTNFIKYQNPTPEADPDLDNIIWPEFLNNIDQYLNINETLEIKSDPRNYNKIREVLDDVLIPPYTLF